MVRKHKETPVYVPPHRKHDNTRSRSRQSEELQGTSRIQLDLDVGCCESHNLDTCPFDTLPAEGSVQRFSVVLPRLWREDDAQELLEWFSNIETPEGMNPSLSLPSTLSKDERKVWHKLAERLRLRSESHGFGEERHITIYLCQRSNQQAPAPTLTREAKQVWAWCQEEGGRFWDFSQGEVEAMLASPSGLPGELRKLCADRQRADDLLRRLKCGDEEGAAAALSSARGDGEESLRRAVWCIRKGMAGVAGTLARMPGVLTQKDRNRLDPFDVAEDSAVAEILCEIRRTQQ
uniref:R3H domain-containing protein n=1 Tax=Tetraselmis sp. GSL018 TaxID=582737 RepID=A0A061QPZ6_9CHLO